MRQFSISTIFTAVDRITAPIRRIEQSIANMTSRTTASAERISNGFRRVDTAANNTGRSMDRLRSRFNFHNQIGHVRDLTSALGRMGHAAKSAFNFATPGFGSLAVGAAGLYAGNSVLNAASEREDFGLSLSTLYGGKQQGLERLNFLEEMAKKLPYGLKDYVGMDTTMKDVGHVADAQGFKGLASIMSAKNLDPEAFIKDMRSMETESLKTILGQIANVHSTADKINFNNPLNGKPMEFAKTAKGIDAFYSFLEDFGNKKYAGLAEQRGLGYSGSSATLSDTIDSVFAKAATESGWLKAATGWKQGFSSALETQTPGMTKFFATLHDKWQGSGVEAKIGSVAVQSFEKALSKLTDSIKAVSDSDITQAVDSLSDLGRNIFDLGAAVGSALPNISRLFKFIAHPLDTALGFNEKSGDSWKFSDTRLGVALSGENSKSQDAYRAGKLLPGNTDILADSLLNRHNDLRDQIKQGFAGVQFNISNSVHQAANGQTKTLTVINNPNASVGPRKNRVGNR